MNTTRMEQFEKVWADRHGVPPESMVRYRFHTVEGYSLPGMASHYRTFTAALDLAQANQNLIIQEVFK